MDGRGPLLLLLGECWLPAPTRARASAAKWVSQQLWHADGVGLVRETFCCSLATEELSSYQVVATASVTWGDIKSRFDP